MLGGTLVALAWANASPSYFDFWHRHLTVGVADFSITEDLRHWVNDGLMAAFSLPASRSVSSPRRCASTDGPSSTNSSTISIRGRASSSSPSSRFPMPGCS
ncbi:MAG: Na+/H+ antiporter NhaA [Acidimicrobiia bacterium]